MKPLLAMIVKNEEARIERALDSVAPYIGGWVITDTGSTDGTIGAIHGWARKTGIPGIVTQAEFIDFSQARNANLTHARNFASKYGCDTLLLCDADMELVVKDPVGFLALAGLGYEMYQKAGAVTYTNMRLVTAYSNTKYLGVTHEYLDATAEGVVPADVAYFADHADGTNRKDKFVRDIKLLKQGMKAEPTNARYMFYLACSYRDAGRPLDAAKWFQRRVNAGGWDEEVWQAQLGLAHARKDIGDKEGFLAGILKAYELRPHRAEAMYDAAHWLRENQQPAAALAFAEAVAHLKRPPNDKLFVNDFVYDAGIKEEIAITSFYVPGKKATGRRVNDELALTMSPYNGVTNTARANQFFYAEKLGDMASTFKWRDVDFKAPDGLVSMNPSICTHLGRCYMNVRGVNYTIDADGRYVIKGTDGTANADNPIDTRNFVLDLGYDPWSPTRPYAQECYRPGNMPVEFPLVTGFEDMRLFSHRGHLWTSSTVRQLTADGECEQVLTRLEDCTGGYTQGGMKRMLRPTRQTEKNWSPIIRPEAPEQLFMWRPGMVVNTDGIMMHAHPSPIFVDNISGSSQVLRWGVSSWLAVVHTAHTLPNSHKRYYTHRFIEYAQDFRIKRASLPFVFHAPVIEFCAGMCWHPQGAPMLYLSYGYEDRMARMAAISEYDVRRILGEGHSYGQ